MRDSQEIPFRIEEDPFVMIDEEVIPNNDSCNSVRQFAEQSIQRHIGDVLELSRGGSLLRKLTRRLTEVENLNESVPESNPTARWGSGNARKRVNPEFGPAVLEKFDKIDTHTGLSQSDISRICLYRSLFELANLENPPFRYERTSERIRRIWIDIENSFRVPREAFFGILHRRFSLMSEKTMVLFRQDLKHFEGFATVYENEFYGGKTYEIMTENYPERAFTNTENVIEELTTISFRESDLEAFLEKELESSQ